MSEKRKAQYDPNSRDREIEDPVTNEAAAGLIVGG